MRSTPEELTLASPLKWNLPPMDCERSLVVPNQQRSHHSLARTGRVHRWLAGAACVCAFALPFTVAWVKDGTAESRASLTAESTVSRPAIARLPQQTGSNHAVDAAHAASMMLVGTLLIGVGSVVRRPVPQHGSGLDQRPERNADVAGRPLNCAPQQLEELTTALTADEAQRVLDRRTIIRTPPPGRCLHDHPCTSLALARRRTTLHDRPTICGQAARHSHGRLRPTINGQDRTLRQTEAVTPNLAY